jgi:hypothetical protein
MFGVQGEQVFQNTKNSYQRSWLQVNFKHLRSFKNIIESQSFCSFEHWMNVETWHLSHSSFTFADSSDNLDLEKCTLYKNLKLYVTKTNTRCSGAYSINRLIPPLMCTFNTHFLFPCRFSFVSGMFVQWHNTQIWEITAFCRSDRVNMPFQG